MGEGGGRNGPRSFSPQSKKKQKSLNIRTTRKAEPYAAGHKIPGGEFPSYHSVPQDCRPQTQEAEVADVANIANVTNIDNVII